MGSTLTTNMNPHGPLGSAAFPKMKDVPESANEITRVTPAAKRSKTPTTGGNRRKRNASNS